MTAEELKQYRSICREIEENEEELERQTAADTVIGSDAQFPFIKRSVTVCGIIPEEENRRRIEKLSRLRRQRERIERFAEDIDDSLTRRIIELRYIKGSFMPSWEAVAQAIGGWNTADGVRKTAARFLKRKSRRTETI